MKCVGCSRFSLRDAGKMAYSGYGNCASKGAAEYRSAMIERECGLFKAASADDVVKRVDWLTKRKERGNGNEERGR